MTVTFGGRTHRPRYPELERLICLAVSNKSIADDLLLAPERALDRIGAYCRLSPVERALVTSINGADDIHEFAAQLYARVAQKQ
jgi:hypothetical protein